MNTFTRNITAAAIFTLIAASASASVSSYAKLDGIPGPAKYKLTPVIISSFDVEASQSGDDEVGPYYDPTYWDSYDSRDTDTKVKDEEGNEYTDRWEIGG